jgi:prevent-host-death family protein
MTNMTTDDLKTRIGLAEAKAKLSAVVDDVRLRSCRYLIERHGKPAAAIISVEELGKLELLDQPKTQPAGALALVGLWADIGDAVIDEMVEHIYKSRETDMDRDVSLDQ